MSRVAEEQISGSFEQIGVVKMFAGSSAPEGYLLCDGSAVSRSTYSDLFAVIGETYGVGDGSTTFNIPDLRARMPIGFNDDGDLGSGDSIRTNKALASTGGESVHTLTEAQLPLHSHSQTIHSHQLNNHTHSLNSHTHTMKNHTHAVNAHSHSQTTDTYYSSIRYKEKTNTTTNNREAYVPDSGPNGTPSYDGSTNDYTNGRLVANATGTTAPGTGGPSNNTTDASTGNTGGNNGNSANSAAMNTGGTGSSNSHENLPSYITLNYIIKT